MNMFSNQLMHIACAAFTILGPVYDQEASGAVVSDTLQAVHANSKSINAPIGQKVDAVTPDTIDAGYFKLQSEPCLPLGPARQTVMHIIGTGSLLNPADAATLSFSWQQIQHYRAEVGSARNPQQCYYFLL